jgi:hypothetical protein
MLQSRDYPASVGKVCRDICNSKTDGRLAENSNGISFSEIVPPYFSRERGAPQI